MYVNFIDQANHRIDTEASPIESDPTLVSRAHERFRQCLESCLCHGTIHKPGCECRELEASYGYQLFKCDHFSCPSYSQGFSTSSERDKHLQGHSQLSRLFTSLDIQASRDPELPFSMDIANSKPATAIFADTPDRSLVLILKDAIQRNDEHLIREVLPSSKLTHEDRASIFEYTAGFGSLAALQAILEDFMPSSTQFGLATHKAIMENNVPAFHFCFERTHEKSTRWGRRTLLGQATWCGNAQVMQTFLQMGITKDMMDDQRPSSVRGSKHFKLFHLKGAQLDEYMVVVERYAMPKFLRQYCFACAVDMNAAELAMAFLQHGAGVNEIYTFEFSTKFKRLKPLDIATKRGHTEMVTLLLENGAESSKEEMLDQRA